MRLADLSGTDCAACFLLQRQNRQRRRAHPGGGAREPRASPANSCSGGTRVAQQPFAQAVDRRGFLAGGAQQPRDGARVRAARPAAPGAAGPPARSPRCFRSTPACGGQPPSGRCGAAKPARGRGGRLRFSGRQQRQDGVHGRLGPGAAADVGPAAVRILFADKNLDRHTKVGSRAGGLRPPSLNSAPAAHRQRRTSELPDACAGATSSMTSVTPAPSQIAP